MADTTFIARATNIVASWLNDVNIVVYRASSAIANAINRTQLAKNSDWINTLDFGGDNIGVVDSTAALNLATQASAVYSTSLYRQVNFTGGTFLLGGGNTSGYVRKGQKLAGAGIGATSINASGTGANTKPLVVLGTSSSAVQDSGGQLAEVCSMQVLGGPSSFGVVDTTACAGWSVHDMMFSSPGVGVLAGGTDGLVHDCLFDDGLNGLIVNGANILVNDCNFYIANYQITLSTGAYDTTITGCQFEYPKISSILLNTGATGLSNIAIADCNFIQNVQYGTFNGAIFIASSGADLLVSGCRFRNLNGAGIKYSTGLGNTLVVEGCIFDGNRTAAGYAQSTTMQGVDATNMVTTIRGSTFRDLPGQPITFGGAEISTLIVEGCDFNNNTGGTSEINITNSRSGSLVIITGCTSSGRPLVNSQTIVPVIYMSDNRDGQQAETVAITTSSHTVAVWEQTLIANFAGTVTLTLPSATIYPNKKLSVRTITANTVVSASANIAPLAGGGLTTAILAATAGKWAELVSDGFNWQVTQGN